MERRNFTADFSFGSDKFRNTTFIYVLSTWNIVLLVSCCMQIVQIDFMKLKHVKTVENCWHLLKKMICILTFE